MKEMERLKENRLLDLYKKYYHSSLDDLDCQNLRDVEPLWQKFIKIKGYDNKEITRDEFGNLCFEFMVSLKANK